MVNKLKAYYRSILYLKSLIVNYTYDMMRYYKYSSFNGREYNERHLVARITAHYHVLEKGFSFPEMKKGFGKGIITNLNRLLKQYENNGFDLGHIAYVTAVSAIRNYASLHENDDLPWIQQLSILKNSNMSTVENIKELNRDELLKHAQANFSRLALNRFSVRDFSTKEVDSELIENAVQIALKTPSVCNRQSWAVKCISDKSLMKKILSLHQGNRGFGEKINQLLVVTTDLSSFDYAKERYQCYIDGGLFSMSLMYALQYNGLASCPLNWSVEKYKDQKMRKALHLRESQTIIMLIAVGHYPEAFKVPSSNRVAVSEILQFVSDEKKT